MHAVWRVATLTVMPSRLSDDVCVSHLFDRPVDLRNDLIDALTPALVLVDAVCSGLLARIKFVRILSCLRSPTKRVPGSGFATVPPPWCEFIASQASANSQSRVKPNTGTGSPSAAILSRGRQSSITCPHRLTISVFATPPK